MTAGLIAAAVAFVSVVGAMLALALAARDSERRCADARVESTGKSSTIAIQEATITTERNRADTEQRRADAFDLELDRVAADADAPGARARVLSRWKRQAPGAADGGDPGSVPHEASAGPVTHPDPDGLERPE